MNIDPRAVIPPSRQSANLTVLAAAAMGFLAVLAVSMILIGNRLAATWTTTLAGTATLTLPSGTPTPDILTALIALPNVTSAREIPPDEQTALLTPWLGDAATAADLPLPVLIELTGEPMPTDKIDALTKDMGLDATLDTHDRWRDPLTALARRLGVVGLGAAVVVLAALVAIVTLAAQAALAANLQVIRTLRLVGASDTFIARAFVRRFTLRALGGAIAGTLVALILTFTLVTSGVLGDGVALSRSDAPYLLAIPLLAAITAFLATRFAAMATLKKGL